MDKENREKLIRILNVSTHIFEICNKNCIKDYKEKDICIKNCVSKCRKSIFFMNKLLTK